MDLPIRRQRASNRLGQLRQNVRRGVVGHGMHCVQAHSIKVIFVQPKKRILYKEIANHPTFRSVKINPIAPWTAITIGEELRSVYAKVISLRTKMVVNHVQQNHDSAAVSALNEFFEILWPTIGTIASKRIDSVVTPISLSRKIRNRHQLHRSDPEFREIVESLPRGQKSSALRERTNVQFIDDGFFPPATPPIIIQPYKRIGVDDFARTVYITRLKARCRIGHLLCAVDLKTVSTSRICRIGS